MKKVTQMKIRNLLLSLFVSASLIFGTAGCQTLKPMKEMTAQERADYVKQKALEWLQNPKNQESTKEVLIIAGTEAMQRAVSGEDREQISNLMWGSAVMYRSLSTGEIITAEKIQSSLKALAPGYNSAEIVKYRSAVNLAWQTAYNNLDIVKDPSLVKAWLAVLAEAAETVGSIYKTP